MSLQSRTYSIRFGAWKVRRVNAGRGTRKAVKIQFFIVIISNSFYCELWPHEQLVIICYFLDGSLHLLTTKLSTRRTHEQLMKWQNDGTLFHFCSLEMMMACWHPDPSQRPSFSEIVASLDQALQAIRWIYVIRLQLHFVFLQEHCSDILILFCKVLQIYV